MLDDLRFASGKIAWAAVWTIRDGLVLAAQRHATRADAMAAIGRG